jgi:hypothetical protein
MIDNHFQPVHLMFGENLWQKIRKPLISIFVVVHFGLVLSHMLPSNPLISLLQRPFSRFYTFASLWQTFGVFAPPRTTNVHLIALINYKNGETRIFPLPRLDRIPLFDKLRKERFRKFLDDNSSWPEFIKPFLQEDIASYAARRCNLYSGNPPRSVSLIRFYTEIPPLKKFTDSITQSTDPLARGPKNLPHTTMKLIHWHYVSEDDLK